MTYETVSVTIEEAQQQYTVSSTRSDEAISISCTGLEKSLVIPLLKSQAHEPRGRFLEKERDFYREQESINARHPVLAFIERLPTPMFLDLERRRQVGGRLLQRGDDWRLVGRTSAGNPLSGSLIESLSDAQELAQETYRNFLAARAKLTDDLKKEIILTMFALGTEAVGSTGGHGPAKMSVNEMEMSERLVNESLSQLGISPERIEETVRPFFNQAKQVANALPSDKKLQELKKIDETVFKVMREWSAIQPKVLQMSRVVELIATYNNRVSTAYAHFDRYLKSVNSFLGDSGKAVSFDPSGNLRVRFEEGAGR